jgi:O-antigen/teichoic acid export membrane protein
VTPSSETESTQRTPLPEGTIPVAVALFVAGITIYAFFKVGTDAVGGEAEFKPLQALWFATFALAPGFFLPLEQELGRALAHRQATGLGGRPVVRRVVLIGGLLLTAVLVATVALGPLITEHYFDGNWVMLVALVLAFASYAPAHLARGIASGSGRFRAYAIVMGADGVVRIVLCLAFAGIGLDGIGPYGLLVAMSPLVGVAWVTSRGELRSEPGPPADWAEVTPNLGWLLLGSVFAAGLVNAGPIAATLLGDDSQNQLVSWFGKGVLMARVPLFLFQAVQAALLPRLSRLAARNEIVEFRAGLRKLMLMVLVVGVVGTAAAYVLGPIVLEKVFDADLSNRTMAMLALASAVYMVALAMAQAVIALRGHALAAVGWGVGMASFVVTTWVASDDLFRRVEIGLLVSSLAAMATFGLALRHQLASGTVPSGASVMEAITDMPFER